MPTCTCPPSLIAATTLPVPWYMYSRSLMSVSRSDCTKSLVTVRSHSTYPAALALPLGAPAGPSRSADARGSGPVYPDRPARSARSELRVRRAATGVGRRWRRTRAHDPPRHLLVGPWRYPGAGGWAWIAHSFGGVEDTRSSRGWGRTWVGARRRGSGSQVRTRVYCYWYSS